MAKQVSSCRVAINKIAKSELLIPTLDTRNQDSLDFYDCNVGTIKRALEAAYQAGAESSTRKAHTERLAGGISASQYESAVEKIADNIRSKMDEMADMDKPHQDLFLTPISKHPYLKKYPFFILAITDNDNAVFDNGYDLSKERSIQRVYERVAFWAMCADVQDNLEETGDWSKFMELAHDL